MSTILYIIKAEKIAKKKLLEYEEATEDKFHHWTGSVTTAMGLMAVMGMEFMICIVLDLCILTGLLLIADLIIYGG